MSAENWLQRSSGLVVPALGFANLAGQMQPCPGGDCCDDDGGCNVCSGVTPEQLEVTITGVDDGFGQCDAGACDEAWNATHILSHFDDSGCDFGVGLKCQWCKQFAFDCFFLDPPHTANFIATAFVPGSPPTFRVALHNVEFTIPPGDHTLFVKDDMPADCESWSDIEIPFFSSILGLERCTMDSSVTVKVTAI